MRRRLCDFTGFGNSSKELLDNKGELDQAFANEAIELYFQKWEGFDYSVRKDHVAVGIEPSYQSDPLKIVTIHKDKDKSFIETGRAFGYYGSGIRSTKKQYAEYKRSCKFKRFVDKWHPVLFPNATRTQ